MARDILCGICHLHKYNLIHRDVKSMNILITNNYRSKITDFGMSKLVDSENSDIYNTANAGTPLWMAPEVKTGTSYGYPSDVYSTGLVLYELIEQKLPDWDKSIDMVVLPQSFVSSEIVLPLVHKDPTQRLSISQALELYDHKYVQPTVSLILGKYPVLSPRLKTNDLSRNIEIIMEALKTEELDGFIFQKK